MKGLKFARKLSVYASTTFLSIITLAAAVLNIGGSIAYENAPLITEALGQDYSSVIEIDQGADAKDTQYYKTKFKTVEEVRESGVNSLLELWKKVLSFSKMKTIFFPSPRAEKLPLWEDMQTRETRATTEAVMFSALIQ